jgi:hypothetical protein
VLAEFVYERPVVAPWLPRLMVPFMVLPDGQAVTTGHARYDAPRDTFFPEKMQELREAWLEEIEPDVSNLPNELSYLKSSWHWESEESLEKYQRVAANEFRRIQ